MLYTAESNYDCFDVMRVLAGSIDNSGICDDAVITHELIVKFADDGSFQYLGNEILNNGIKEIPDYQYRINVN